MCLRGHSAQDRIIDKAGKLRCKACHRECMRRKRNGLPPLPPIDPSLKIKRDVLTQALKRRCWTRITLAILSKVSYHFIGDISTGRNGARQYTRMRICKVLGMRHDDLWQAPK